MEIKTQKFLWLDMEMTGLDPEREVIIEVATLVTNHKFEELDTCHQVVRQHPDYLEKMDKWNTKQHKKSGLYDLIPCGIPQDQMENILLSLADKHFKDKKIVLAGNSIYQDRLFIKKHLLKFAKRLHYRMLDISALKIIFGNMGVEFKKENKHRALDDIRESVRELKAYLHYIDESKLPSQSLEEKPPLP